MATTLAFDAAARDWRNARIPLALVYSDQGLRAFSASGQPSFNVTALAAHDRTILYDGSRTYGSDAVLLLAPTQPRVVNWGVPAETLAPTQGTLPASLGQSRRGTTTLEIDNADGWLGAILQTETFLGQAAWILLGYAGLSVADFAVIFAGRVTRQIVRHDVHVSRVLLDVEREAQPLRLSGAPQSPESIWTKILNPMEEGTVGDFFFGDQPGAAAKVTNG